MKLTTLFLLIALLFSFKSADAQLFGEGRADRLYNSFAYTKAIRIYQKVVKRKGETPHLVRQLANSYRLTLDPVNAEIWYAKLIATANVEPIDYYYYAKALESNGKYTESGEMMKKYNDLSQHNESKVSPEIVTAIKTDSLRYVVKNLEVNSPFADFGTCYLGKKMVFASSRENKKMGFKYSWNEKPYLDLYISDINSANDLENVEKLAGKVNTIYHEGPATFSPTGDTIYFTRNNYTEGKTAFSSDGTNNLKIYSGVVKKSKAESPKSWKNIKCLGFNGDEFSTGHPSLSADGKKMYFSSDRAGSIGGTDIYVSTLENGTWSEPKNLGDSINTSGNEMFPFIHPSGILYFASNGHAGMGGLDIFAAFPTENAWSTPINLGASINSNRDDFACIVDSLFESGYFSSNREGGKGDDDIYFFKMNYLLKGFVYEKIKKFIIEGASLVLKDESNNVVGTFTTDSKTNFVFPIEPRKKYTLVCQHKDYEQVIDQIEAKNINPVTRILRHDVFLKKITGEYVLEGLVTHRKTSLPVSEVKIVVNNSTTQAKTNFVTNEKGDFTMPLDAETDYSISFEKTGYLTQNELVTTKNQPFGTIKVHKILDDSNDIPPEYYSENGFVLEDIFYYFDMSNIRFDASASLQKLIKIMKKYPDIKIELSSHTDCRGTFKYNMALSKRRVDSAFKYMTYKGIDKNRMSKKWYGETKLVNECADGVDCDEAKHQKNRRTEVRIISGLPPKNTVQYISKDFKDSQLEGLLTTADGKPIAGMKISVTAQHKHHHRDLVSNEKGEFSMNLMPEIEYDVRIEKEGYKTITEIVSTKGKSGNIKLAKNVEKKD